MTQKGEDGSKHAGKEKSKQNHAQKSLSNILIPILETRCGIGKMR